MSQSRNTSAQFSRIRLSKPPTHSHDAATKSYVDNNAGGGIVKTSTKTDISNTTGTILPPSALLSGFINRTSNDVDNTHYDKFPTAHSLVNSISGATVGSYFDFMYVCNVANGVEFDLSTSEVDGYKFRGDGDVGNEEMRIFRVLITDTSLDSEFYHIFQYDN
jgi:hypothetical protein